MTPLDAALHCADRSWPVFPTRNKRPLTPRGQNDATAEPSIITGWWQKWSDATPAIRTGGAFGVVGLDIDQAGIPALDDLMPIWPETPTCSTPSGGFHLLLLHPGGEVRTGVIAPGLEVKGERSSLILAPGPGRVWDPHLDLDTLTPVPGWLVIDQPTPPPAGPRPTTCRPISRYAEQALDSAVNRITHAPAGVQHETLNREVYTIAGLVAGGVLPAPLALEALQWAARQMPSHDPRRPWRNTDKLVNAAFLDGLRHPRRLEVRR